MDIEIIPPYQWLWRPHVIWKLP